MKRISSLALVLGIISLQGVSAERIMGTPGVISEFTQVEELVKNKKITKEYRKKTLEQNLLNAVKFTFLKKYPDYQEKVKELNPESISFEQQKGTYNYYLKFKDYFLYYNFALDPEIYVQLPVDEKFYIKNQELASAGDSSSSAPSSPKPEAENK
ncbi:MAG: hypothetical protein H7A24_08790 [Leptospiraceae bacterium]|nr:hypothetical protein [Leptospiraceae bacterium]MCP5511964.1 hypothetical protein [Leptospiraceae bacterium]